MKCTECGGERYVDQSRVERWLNADDDPEFEEVTYRTSCPHCHGSGEEPTNA